MPQVTWGGSIADVPLALVEDTVGASERLSVEDLAGVHPRVMRNVQEQLRIDHLFPMQWVVLRRLLSQSDRCGDGVGDVLVNAPTGSGKTLIYALPIVSGLAQAVPQPCVRALVLVPTHDLVQQVEAVFRALCAGEGVAAAVQLVTAAKDRPPRHTVALRRSAVFITTCGHLLDLMESDAIDLRYLRWLVLDEADRLLQQSGHEWLGRVLRTAGHGSGLMYPPLKPLRKVLLSATQTQEAEHLARLQLHRPVFYAYRWGEGSEGAADSSRPRRLSRAPSTLQSVSVVCAAEAEKLELLLRMAGYDAGVGNANRPLRAHDQMVIFTKSVSAAHRLARFLQLALDELPRQPCVENDAEAGVSAGHVAEFSRHLAPVARARMLQRLRDRSLQYLVCSDVMARGIDVLSVDAVVNYDVPAHVTTFVHRVGRTARAGRPGTCYTLLLERQQAYFEREIQGPALGGDADRVFVHRAHELLEETQRAAVSMHCRRFLRAVRLVLEAERWGIVPADEPLSAEWCAYALRYAGSAQESAPQETEPQAHLQQTLHSVALRNWLS